MNSSKEKEKKRGFRASDFMLVVLAILGIMNTLMIDRAKIPDWYFYSSIGLIVIATAVFFVIHFGSSWNDKINAWREENKRNKIAHKYFLGFRNLVDTSRRFNSSIREIEDSLRTHYSDNIKSSLARHVLENHVELETKSSFFEIEKRLEELNKNFRDLSHYETP